MSLILDTHVMRFDPSTSSHTHVLPDSNYCGTMIRDKEDISDDDAQI